MPSQVINVKGMRCVLALMLTRFAMIGLTTLQVMLWQRKIELEREMNDVLDPSVGVDVVGAMKKEIHRMQLRAAELSRIQEGLLLDLERSIAKRDTIALKVSHPLFAHSPSPMLILLWSSPAIFSSSAIDSYLVVYCMPTRAVWASLLAIQHVKVPCCM